MSMVLKKISWTRGLKRFVLWTAALSLLSVLRYIKPKIRPTRLETYDTSSVSNPVAQGVSSQGDPYMIQAKKAFFEKQKVLFSQPKMISKRKETVLHLSSQKGSLDLEKKNVHLTDDVVLKGQNYHIETPQMSINLHDKKMNSTMITEGKAPFGSFQCRGFTWDKGHLMLQGPVEVEIKRKEKKGPSVSLKEKKSVCLATQCAVSKKPLCL